MKIGDLVKYKHENRMGIITGVHPDKWDPTGETDRFDVRWFPANAEAQSKILKRYLTLVREC